MGKNNNKLTFGLLIDSVFYGYHKRILSGIIDFAKEKDINLLCFLTGRLKILKETWNKNILFDLIDKSNIDGLIIATTALQNFVGVKKFIEFLKRYYPIPIASIGEKIPDYPSFIIDNEKSMTMLLTHLVNIHSYKKIAFITGPIKNSEAQHRFNAYKNILKQHNIPFDPDLVVNGDFNSVSGRNAASTLIKERKVDLDIIVAANDEMALGAIEELAYLGIQVPGKAFIVGFDDTETSKNIGLTTVKQPLYEQGYFAAQSIFKWLNNEKYDLVNILPTELIIRESCGCYSPNVLLSPIWNIPIVKKSNNKPFTINKDEIIKEICNSIIDISPEEKKHIKKWSNNLLESLINSYKDLTPNLFLKTCNKIIFEIIVIKLPLSFLQRIITSLRKNTLYCNKNDKQKIFFEDLFHQARIILEEAEQKSTALQNIILAIQNERLINIEDKLTNAGSLDELLNVIHKEFPKLEIKSCFLSLFKNPEDPMNLSKLILAYDNYKRINIKKDGINFSTKQLTPKLFLPKNRRYNYMIQSLVHREEYLGFILMELGDSTQLVNFYESLCNKISTTLRFIMLLEKTISQAQNLELINKKLKQSNRQLEEFAYVASHDLQEPLRKINIFGNQLKKKCYSSLNDQERDYLDRMRNAVNRMHNLIHDLLTYSRITTAKKLFMPVDLSIIIKDILSDLEIQINKTSGQIKIDKLPTIETNPLQMRQLFQNLISNALKFHKPKEPPLINIYTLKDTPKDRCIIIVEDNGIGIEKENYNKIFGVFQRVYAKDEYEGSGIGLAICKNIVENHGGSIHIESKFGIGAKFIINLPIKQLNKS